MGATAANGETGAAICTRVAGATEATTTLERRELPMAMEQWLGELPRATGGSDGHQSSHQMDGAVDMSKRRC